MIWRSEGDTKGAVSDMEGSMDAVETARFSESSIDEISFYYPGLYYLKYLSFSL